MLEEIVGPLGFAEMIFPKLVPWEVWAKSGHAKGVYPEIYYVSAPKTRDPAYWEEVADYFKVTGEVPVDLIREKIDGPIGGLCYAQCPSFWPFVGGATLANDCLPARVFDRSGTSHRYESGGIHGIERVDEFHRIEILWLGTPEQTVETADLLHERYRHLFDEVLELEWRSARVTPWFMAQEGMLGGEGVRADRDDRLRGLSPVLGLLARVPERLGQRRQVPAGVQRESPVGRRPLVGLLGDRARALDRRVPRTEGLRPRRLAGGDPPAVRRCT